jgi:16S rRNA processing protein RimM
MYIIGTVLKAQGIRGEIKVKPLTPRLERFKSLNKVYLKKETIQTCSVEAVRLSNGFVYLKLKEIQSRTAAELLRGAEILVEQQELLELEPDEYFVHDLIGCRAVDEQGINLGKIVDVIQLSSNDVYVVQSDTGREILIPAIKDVVKQVIPESKLVVIHLLEGLLD